MTAHISSVIKSYYCHLRSPGKLWPFLTQDAADVIAVSLIMSRLDYCNNTLWGILANHLNHQQKIQNGAHRNCDQNKVFRTHHPCPAVIALAPCHQTD